MNPTRFMAIPAEGTMDIPSFAYEQTYWAADIAGIAGIDEAGMGALAGPVVASAVIFQRDSDFRPPAGGLVSDFKIRDSKTLSAAQREKAAAWIKEHALSWAVGEATIDEISTLNIRGAAHLAMRRAVDQLDPAPDMLLIDGTEAAVHPEIPAVNIIKGDSLSFSIAAASIVAKVHRDALMIQLDAEFPAYGFASHKGYGSRAHLEALQTHGASPHHRPTYAPVARLLIN